MANLITTQEELEKLFNEMDLSLVSSLGNDNCVTQGNMNFENKPGAPASDAILYIFNTDPNKDTDVSYAMAITPEINDIFNSNFIKKFTSASGTCTVGSGEGKTTNISFTLNEEYQGKIKLRFSNADVETINGSTKDDVIYIDSSKGSKGVSETATLDFSQGGTDTIYFNGATTVQKISGGGVRREYTYSKA